MTHVVATDRLEAFRAAAVQRIRAGTYRIRGDALHPNGSLVDALKTGAIIAELKPRSPSAGRLLHGDPQDVLDAYVEGGAAAVSVLADGDFFDGSPELVRQAHGTGLPVLWKDFVIGVEQVHAAAHHGASAVLLIESLFDGPGDREALVDAAHACGLEVLLEVHSTDEAGRARSSAADVLGVNARDLRTLREDPDHARAVIRGLRDDGRPLIALSSIATRHDVRQAIAVGATACLVGTTLMRDPDPALRLKALRRPLAKVCGVTDAASLHAALQAHADLVGFVVGVPSSPRNLTPDAAADLIHVARHHGVRTVLVTGQKDPCAVMEAALHCRPHMLQTHGCTLRPAQLDALVTSGIRRVQGASPDAVPDDGDLVLDASRGTGNPLDLEAAARTVQAAPGRFVLIAGGLGPDDVADAVRRTGATGADASSSLESAPGIKDPERIRAFVEAVHGA